MQSHQLVIGKRYQLREQIGAGGMGVVYRATDRLSAQTVALKRVTVPTAQLEFASQAGYAGANRRLALAREFKTLASLRHPHIINVLDYGFDADGQPYFTMDLLEGAQTLVEAGRGQSTAAQVAYLVQTLQALAYLHRRGTLHRDLKPGNVLVSPADGRACVLDFGLSVDRQAARGRVGTMAYIAPEVLRKGQASEASDLYAVGVMAYQLFAGRHPFDLQSARTLVSSLQQEADVSPLPDTLGPVVARLLARDPAARYQDAQRVIQALCAAVGQPLPEESAAIRESFLQAAQFVGREAEFAQLTEALAQAMRGQGSAWLVGGESGVGKTRLLDELRIQALVYGVTVLRGQAVEEDRAPYRLWRDVLRPLALSTELNDLQAGVLRPILPDIETLLGRAVPDAPALEGGAAHQRLILTIADAIQTAARAARPVLLILEDLQWVSDSGESLELLRQLERTVTALPLLVVGSFRDEERPTLPDELPGLRVMSLQRLDERGVVELSASMLGEPGQQPHVVELLQEETEGNAFFLVEVVRALAEEAGRLGDVGLVTLPGAVFTQGIHRIVQRRLNRVPQVDRPLLRLAAVAGRVLDLEVLRTLALGGDLAAWLTTGANVAVLEVRQGQWRFVHDKLREVLLADLSAAKRAALHQRVAEAIRACYAPDLSDHYADLAYHYGQAHAVEQERRYAILAGKQAAAQFANDAAQRYFSRALALTPDDDLVARYDLLAAREKVYALQGVHEAQAQDIASLQRLAGALNDDARRAQVALRQADYTHHTADYAGAMAAAQAAIDLAQASQDVNLMAAGHLRWGQALGRWGDFQASRSQLEQALALARAGNLRQVEADSLCHVGEIYWRQSDYAGAKRYLEQALRIYREIGDRQGEAKALNRLGGTFWSEGNYDQARACFENCLHICHEIGDRGSEGRAWGNLGIVSWAQGDYARAEDYYGQAWQILREIGDRRGEGQSLNNLGNICEALGKYAQSRYYLEQALHLHREIQSRPNEALALNNLGSTLLRQANYDEARACLEQALHIFREMDDKYGAAHAWKNLGDTRVGLGAWAQAATAYRQALGLYQELGQPGLMMESLAGLAHVHLAQGELAQALARVEEVLGHLEESTLEGMSDLFQALLICYRVLQASQDARAGGILDQAHHLLQERAARIPDEETRRSFLENVAPHREIVNTWRKLNTERQNG